MGGGGQLDASVGRRNGDFNIEQIIVDPDSRRQGIATTLVERAREKALELEAAEISASLRTHEIIHLMRKVFGDEAVTVEDEGTPLIDLDSDEDPPYDAKARLLIKLADNTSGNEVESSK